MSKLYNLLFKCKKRLGAKGAWFIKVNSKVKSKFIKVNLKVNSLSKTLVGIFLSNSKLTNFFAVVKHESGSFV